MIVHRGGILLVHKKLVELGLMTKGEPNLHLERSIDWRSAQRCECFGLNGVVSIQPYPVIGKPSNRVMPNYR